MTASVTVHTLLGSFPECHGWLRCLDFILHESLVVVFLPAAVAAHLSVYPTVKALACRAHQLVARRTIC